MGVFAEIAGELPEECLHDNLIFKYLINKKIEESTLNIKIQPQEIFLRYGMIWISVH